MDKLLEVKNLSLAFQTASGRLSAINGASFSLYPGEFFAVVGESGSGKSVLTQSIVRLTPSPPAYITGGEILFEGKDLVRCTEGDMADIRGKKISVIFQDAMTALNPTMKIGEQITEVIMRHMRYGAGEARAIARALTAAWSQADPCERDRVVTTWLMDHFRFGPEELERRKASLKELLDGKRPEQGILSWILNEANVTRAIARKTAVDLLKLVKIPDAEKRVDQYIFQFSGGMRQRVMVAVALACRPKILIADEPTTALDVTIKNEVLDLLRELVSQLGTSVILITHDLGVVASYAGRIGVMYAGGFVETGLSREIFYSPRHPYTQGLLNAIPRLDSGAGNTLKAIKGSPPNLLNKPEGCPFARRCDHRMNICLMESPGETVLSETHAVRCFLTDKRARRLREAKI